MVWLWFGSKFGILDSSLLSIIVVDCTIKMGHQSGKNDYQNVIINCQKSSLCFKNMRSSSNLSTSEEDTKSRKLQCVSRRSRLVDKSKSICQIGYGWKAKVVVVGLKMSFIFYVFNMHVKWCEGGVEKSLLFQWRREGEGRR